MTPQDTLAAARGRLPAALALLEALVNLDTGSHALDALAAAGQWLETQLEALGLQARRLEFPDAGPIVVGTRAGAGRARLLFLAHYDTVFDSAEVRRRPFRSDGQRAYGPGVADMKGGVVTLWEALRLLGASGWDDYASLTVLHNADEEIGSPRSRAVIEEEARRTDLCFVLEPGRPDGSVVTARKGVGRYTLTVHGRAAHAGAYPQDGASALVALAHKIVELHALNDYARGLTVNVVVTEGGTRANVVPEVARAEIDVRVPAMAQVATLEARLREIAAREHLPRTHAVLEGGVNRPPMEPSPRSQALLALAQASAQALGFALPAASTGGGSDGNFVAALGVPVLDGLGAVGGGFHSAEEYLEVASLPQRAVLLALVVPEACRRPEIIG
ncbi:MAG: M20 family metallopeptidase [Armatimonadota bacterium]|nr:M20 family metallopeptidase [Armatimonadota bacterium]MDR7485987.1 M20 family metallopeptidase [Armatimonadota bacterium]MDR7533516.1 M20 family metallopeptidase [Armatimonadota bacterium]MDR7536894.1 M20 family metallopeptidase [Armatimonadota bacterium]